MTVSWKCIKTFDGKSQTMYNGMSGEENLSHSERTPSGWIHCNRDKILPRDEADPVD
jgi:hypothetical protein